MRSADIRLNSVIRSFGSGRFDQIYGKTVKPYIHDYMGLIFEQMCRQYLMRYAESLPVLLSNAGQWWRTDKQLRKEVQIDIVGMPIEGDSYLIGYCKYLIRHYSAVFGKGKNNYYYIFSLGGFTKNLIELENQGEVTLVTLEDLYA